MSHSPPVDEPASERPTNDAEQRGRRSCCDVPIPPLPPNEVGAGSLDDGPQTGRVKSFATVLQKGAGRFAVKTLKDEKLCVGFAGKVLMKFDGDVQLCDCIGTNRFDDFGSITWECAATARAPSKRFGRWRLREECQK